MMLMREFAASNSEPAFATLVGRHIGLVHSAALRQVGEAHLAEEITQAVFIILARKAASLGPNTVLSAWLYRTTRYAARDALKARRRRDAREQEAYMQSTLNQPDTDAAWVQLAPLLDDAMNELGETDRAALVLRFFENKTAREIAEALRMKEDTAQKRVARALGKLRALFVKRGVTLTATVIAGAVAANSVQAVPAGFATAITATALSGTSLTTAAVIAATKALAMTTLQKTLVTVALVATLGVGIFEAHQNSQLREKNQILQQQQAALVGQIQQLHADSESISGRFTETGNPAKLSAEQFSELLKLRGVAGTLQQQTDELNRLRHENRKLLSHIAAQSESTNQVSAEDRFILQQTHAVDAMTSLLNSIKNYASNHNGLYPQSFGQLTASGDLGTPNFAGNLRLDDFEFVKGDTIDLRGNKVLLRIRVPPPSLGRASAVVSGAISDDGVPQTEIVNTFSPE
ncbi:MAG: hypothetical protein QOD03_190 [Verrucomicrobiota bacterium]